MKRRNLVLSIMLIICFGILSLPVLGNNTKKSNNQSIMKSFLNLSQSKNGTKKDFGIYQKYVPNIKIFIKYAKTHKVPATKREDILELTKTSTKITNIINAGNMNVIYFSDGYYIKLLQNMVAIYGPCSYHLDFTLTGETTCVGKNQKGYQECKALGGKKGAPNKRMPSWIPYKLPQNIFD